MKNKKTKIVIAGFGPVGKAMYETLRKAESIELHIDDPQKQYFVDENQVDPEAVIVAVATPDRNGSCNTTHVEEVFKKYGRNVKFLVKSTINPVWLSQQSSTYNITFSPEFLRGTTSRAPTEDFLNSELAIYGGGEMRWWHELFSPHMKNLKHLRFVSLEQAAFGKYLENCFLAMKVTFFNEMYQVYNSLNFKDFDGMVEAICNDSRIGHSHTQVPGPDGKFGYGGHCFPKDVAAFCTLANENNVDTILLTSMKEANKRYRDENN